MSKRIYLIYIKIISYICFSNWISNRMVGIVDAWWIRFVNCPSSNKSIPFFSTWLDFIHPAMWQWQIACYTYVIPLRWDFTVNPECVLFIESFSGSRMYKYNDAWPVPRYIHLVSTPLSTSVKPALNKQFLLYTFWLHYSFEKSFWKHS